MADAARLRGFERRVRVRFLRLFAASGDVGAAAAMVGTTKARVFERQYSDPEFAAGWQAALAQRYAALEAELLFCASQALAATPYASSSMDLSAGDCPTVAANDDEASKDAIGVAAPGASKTDVGKPGAGTPAMSMLKGVDAKLILALLSLHRRNAASRVPGSGGMPLPSLADATRRMEQTLKRMRLDPPHAPPREPPYVPLPTESQRVGSGKIGSSHATPSGRTA